MRSSLPRWLMVALPCVAAMAAPAQGGLQKQVIRGFEFFGWQFSGQRNILGDGWDVFAVADYRAGRSFNFGLGSLTLGDAVVSASTGWTLRGIPVGRFSLTTNDTPLSYTYKMNTGWQNMSVTGNVLFDVNVEMNPLGFYDETIQISNRATLDSGGVLGEHTQDLDYDIGPIDLSGNFYLDALAAVTQPFFDASGAENPFIKLSPQAMKVASMTERVEDLRARVAAGELLTDEEMAALISNSMLLSMLDPGSALGTLEGFVASDDLLATGAARGGELEMSAYLDGRAPEPTTLGLLAIGLVPLLPIGRGWRRASL